MPDILFLCHGHCNKHRLSPSVFRAANDDRCREKAFCVDSQCANEPDKICDLRKATLCFPKGFLNVFTAVYLMACPYSVYTTRQGPRVSFWKAMTRILKPRGEILCLLHERAFKPYGHPYRSPKDVFTNHEPSRRYNHLGKYRNQFASHVELICKGQLRYRIPLRSELEISGLEHIAVIFRKCTENASSAEQKCL